MIQTLQEVLYVNFLEHKLEVQVKAVLDQEQQVQAEIYTEY